MSNYREGEENVKLEFGAVITKLDKPLAGLQNSHCKYRRKCLDYAAKKRWQGFSCKECRYRENKAIGKTGVMSFLDYHDLTGLPVHCEIPNLKEDWKI